jgi:hypothetical protein
MGLELHGGPVQRKAAGQAPGAIQRACVTCGGAIGGDQPCAQCKEQATPAAAATPAASTAPAAAPLVPSGGQALAPAVRAPFERAFSTDFGDVRVHDGGGAAASARSIDAKAFTTGSDIVFGAGHLSSDTPEGQRLLAHELTHVVQQRAHGSALSAFGAPGVSAPSDAAEHEADRAADAFMAGRPVGTPSTAPSGIARAPRASAPTDWQIHRPGTPASLPTGSPQRVFFDRNADAVAAGDPAITAAAAPPDADLQLLGYASADELTADPSIVQRRVDHVTAALVAAGHDAAHITATLRPSAGRIDYRRVRSVEIVRPGEASVEPVVGAPTTQPCDPAIETAFQDAKDHAINDLIDPVLVALGAPIVAGSPLEAALTKFFHSKSHAATVRANLLLIKAEIAVVTAAANHDCGTMNDSSCAAGAIAFNSGHRMTICPGYVPIGGVISPTLRDDHARNLIHEAAHSTGGLQGVPANASGGTSDFGYRHQRAIQHLPLAKELANSDSYAMFVLMANGVAAAIAPPVDTAGAGFTMPADQPAFDRAELPVARIESWIRRTQQWISQTHGEVRKILDLPVGDPARSWAGRFAEGARLARLAGFDVHAASTLPAADDDVKYAAINDRLSALARMLQAPIEISRDATAGAHMHFVAGPPLALVVNPTFLSNGPDVRASMMLERLVDIVAPTEISATLRPAYVDLVRRVRDAESL